MNYRPILFSTSMVEAIENNTKTQTRRKIKDDKIHKENVVFSSILEDGIFAFARMWNGHHVETFHVKPKVNKGDVFWVRETWQKINSYTTNKKEFVYRTEYPDPEGCIEDWQGWKPSIFMPKKACRYFLKVKDVRVERLQNITDDDAKKEGIYITDDYWGEKAPFNYMLGTKYGFKHQYFFGDDPYGMEGVPTHSGWKASFFTLWWSINGKQSLIDNPFVWVYEFEKIEKPLDFDTVSKAKADKK